MGSADESDFNFAEMSTSGLKVLENGLPHVPRQFNSEMAIPIACWEGPKWAAVLFLSYAKNDDGHATPRAIRGIFRRDETNWVPLEHWSGSGWSHDPLVDADSISDLGGRCIYVSGGSYGEPPLESHPAIVMNGRHSPVVKTIAVTQNGLTQSVAANGLWGAWIVSLTEWAPYKVAALEKDGSELQIIEGPTPLPSGARME